MKKTNLRSGLKATTTICSAILSAALVPALVAGLAPATAEAQDYTSGAVVVSVKSPAGAPVAGATVTLVSQAQGISKTLTTNSTGAVTAAGLVPGEYDVTVTASGYDTFKTTATVSVSQTVTYTYSMSTTGASTEVVVKGKRVRQDFNRTTQGLSVDLTTLTAQQPIGRSIQAVTLLAPTAVNSQAFGQPSIGGGSAAENAFYVNGLNITNPDTFIGGATVPFDFYKTVDVKTSGYAAEFGRATGGVVSATTKSGTNDFMFAVHGNFAPDALRSPRFATVNTTSPEGFRKDDANSLIVESGGALIKDKLFLYGLVQVQDTKSRFASTSGGYLEYDKTSSPFYGLKADWYITPGQHIEATYFDTTATTNQTRYTFDGNCPDGYKHTSSNFRRCLPGYTGTAAQLVQSPTTIGTTANPAKTETGGASWVLKYTGNVNDWLTISAAYGDTKDKTNFTSGDPSAYYAHTLVAGVFQKNAGVKQFYSGATTVDAWERKFYRGDADVRFEWLGKHHVRVGFDHEDVSMQKTTILPGAQPIRYYLLPSYGYGYIIYERLGGHVTGKASSYYLQDSWDITPNLNIQVGLRNDDFEEYNLSNQKFLDLKGNLAPRLGFSWKPSDDSKWRFTGSYGQYYIPPAMNLGFRGKDLYFAEYYDMPSGGYVLDANGIPVNMGTPDLTRGQTCPVAGQGSAPGNLGNGGLRNCTVFGDGSQEPADKKAVSDLKATRETEYTLGASYRANDLWTFGLTYVNRKLDRVSEDTDFAPDINAYCATKGYTTCDFANEYHVWNVGKTVTINTFSTLPGGEKQLTFTNLKFPKPERNYYAATFDFKRAFDGKWGLQGSYTYSRSTGNYEGTVLSTGSGGSQSDAGSTLLYDYPGLAENSTGVLINDRDHTFKVWGSYAITPDFLVGANAQVVSPGYLSCYGRYPVTSDPANGYGANSHFCYNTTTHVYDAAPAGKGAKTDWTKNIDVSLRYTVPSTYSLGGKLILRADIFNLLDTKEITARNMASDSANSAANVNFLLPTAYNQSRFVRVGFDLSY